MIRGGLSSVSYRNAEPETVISAAKAAGLGGIEWTADTHVPHGDNERAETVMMATLRAGLTISAYGSFYRIDGSAAADSAFATVLGTARRLQAPIIRVWGGPAGSLTDPEKAAALGAALADIAGKYGITVCVEPHERSAIADFDILGKILEKAAHPFLKACWTHLPSGTRESCFGAAEAIGPHLALAHVRIWTPYPDKRMDDGDNPSLVALRRMEEHNRGGALDHWALIEFLADDSPETLKREAAVLAAHLSRA